MEPTERARLLAAMETLLLRNTQLRLDNELLLICNHQLQQERCNWQQIAIAAQEKARKLEERS